MNQSSVSNGIGIPQKEDWPLRIGETAFQNMRNHESCTQAILGAFMDELEIDAPMVMRSAGALHGGMVSSLTCGVITGGLMVLGLLVGREDIKQGFDGLFPIILPAQELVKRLTKKIGSNSCKEITGIDFADLEQAMAFMGSDEKLKCIGLVRDGAEEIARFLQEQDKNGHLFTMG